MPHVRNSYLEYLKDDAPPRGAHLLRAISSFCGPPWRWGCTWRGSTPAHPGQRQVALEHADRRCHEDAVRAVNGMERLDLGRSARPDRLNLRTVLCPLLPPLAPRLEREGAQLLRQRDHRHWNNQAYAVLGSHRLDAENKCSSEGSPHGSFVSNTKASVACRKSTASMRAIQIGSQRIDRHSPADTAAQLRRRPSSSGGPATPTACSHAARLGRIADAARRPAVATHASHAAAAHLDGVLGRVRDASHAALLLHAAKPSSYPPSTCDCCSVSGDVPASLCACHSWETRVTNHAKLQSSQTRLELEHGQRAEQKAIVFRSTAAKYRQAQRCWRGQKVQYALGQVAPCAVPNCVELQAMPRPGRTRGDRAAVEQPSRTYERSYRHHKLSCSFCALRFSL
eukprot:6180015-Pleurochrysis_carterae.AAC.1